MASFPIILGQGLALTVPPGGAAGPVTLTPLDPANSRQKFVNAKKYISPEINAATALEIQLLAGQNEPVEGNPVALVAKDKAHADTQKFNVSADGVFTSDEYDDLTLAFGGVVVAKVGSPLARASAPAATVTVKNLSGGPVYLAVALIPNGATVPVPVLQGTTIHAIDANGKVISPTPLQVSGSQAIVLSQMLSVTVSNDNLIDVVLKAVVGQASTVTIKGGTQNVIVSAALGVVFEVYDAAGKKLMFWDDFKGVSLEQVLIDEATEIYHVVIPCENTFLNNTGGTISLNWGTTPVTIPAAPNQYNSRVAPNTVFTARDGSGRQLTFTPMTPNGIPVDSLTVTGSGTYYAITTTPPTPSYSVTLSNTTTSVTIKVQVQGSATVYTLNPGASSQNTLLKGTVLTALSSPPGTPVAPDTITIHGPVTITYTAGLQLLPAQIDIIKSWLPGKTFLLRYKASRDGWSASAFHYFCDGVGPTFVVITSVNDYKFGGYAPDSWNVAGGYGRDKLTFVYTLTNPHGIEATKFALLPAATIGIMTDPSTGAAFGEGNDVYVSEQPNTDNKSYTRFPTSFGPDTAAKKGSLLFTGALNYLAKEVEVYRVL